MLGFDFGKRESRKFIDLLLDSTNKWINIETGKEVRVGDFGVIEASTGEFQVEGNLYDLPEIEEIMIKHPIVTAPEAKVEKYTSRTVKELGFSLKAEVGLELVANVGVDASWEFGRKRGALLLLLNPHSKYMRTFPKAAILAPQTKILLKNKVICTDVTYCPAFCLYLANSENHTLKVSFDANAPIAAAPGVTVGGGLGTSWNLSGTRGIVKEGVNERSVFCPLFALKAISWGTVSSVTRGDEDPCVPDDQQGLTFRTEEVTKPWKYLNEEGDECLIPDDEESQDEVVSGSASEPPGKGMCSCM